MRTHTNPHGRTRYVSAAHWHQTIAGAIACTARDRADCRGLGGGAYSDRDVYAVEPGASHGSPVEEVEA